MSKHMFEMNCGSCNAKIKGYTEEGLDLNLQEHMYKKHPAMYSLFMGYSKIENKGLEPNTERLEEVKNKGVNPIEDDPTLGFRSIE